MTKERLRQYCSLVREIDELKERIERLRAKCESGAIIITDTPRGGAPPDYMSELLDAISKLRIIESRLLSEMVAIEEYISQIQDSTTRMIFRYRYIQGMKWEDIADKVHYHVRYVKKIHSGQLKKEPL